MCLIAQRTNTGAHIPNNIIDYNLTSNPDGFGIAWRDPAEGVLFEKFAPSSRNAFRDLLKRIDQTNLPYAAHWRKATHGPACLELAHPFEYVDADGVPMLAFHNGIINSVKTKGNESDTLVFVESVLANLQYGWWDNPAMMFLIEEAIGWSRLLLMTPDSDIIVNESAWQNHNGLLYSTSPGPGTYSSYSGGSYKGTPFLGTGKNSKNGGTDTGKDVKSDDDVDYQRWLRESANEGWPTWHHAGHNVEPISQFDSADGNDRSGDIICTDCREEGDYYVLDGKVFIDIKHVYDADAENYGLYDKDAQACLLPF